MFDTTLSADGDVYHNIFFAMEEARRTGACEGGGEDADEGGEPSPAAPGVPGRSQCRCCVACSRPRCLRSLAVAFHGVLLFVGLFCLIPMDVMTSVLRAFLGGIATFAWLLCCCVMAATNVVALARRRYRKGGDAADVCSEENDASNGENGDAARVLSTCDEMGCLCGADSEASCFGAPCSAVVILLLAVEGMLLLAPVFASTSAYKSLNNGAIDAVFPGASSLAVDPRPTAFSFGQHMLPGPFSFYGGYNNNRGNAETLQYKEGCQPECELDIHTPDYGSAMPSSGYPVIFHVHGGGWDSGDKSSPLIPITYWLERGYAFVSIQYRFPSLTPGGATIFEQLDDVEDAFEYMLAVGPERGLDTSRVLFFGDSAGGHLACTAAYRSGDPGIRGVMNLYGATEWEFYVNSGYHHRRYGLDDLTEKLRPPDTPSEEVHRAASCSTYATPDSAPILTVHGTWDSLVPLRVSEHLHTVVDALGVSNLLVKIPTAQHLLEAGFYSTGGQPTVYAMERFVAARLLSSN